MFNPRQTYKDFAHQLTQRVHSHESPLAPLPDFTTLLTRMQAELAAQQLEDAEERAEYQASMEKLMTIAQNNAQLHAHNIDPVTQCDVTVARSDDDTTLTYSVTCGNLLLARVSRPAPRKRGRQPCATGTTTTAATKKTNETESTTTASSTMPKEQRVTPTPNLPLEDLIEVDPAIISRFRVVDDGMRGPQTPDKTPLHQDSGVKLIATPPRQAKSLEQLANDVENTGLCYYYAFMMVYYDPPASTALYIGFSVNPHKEVSKHNLPLFKCRDNTNHSGYWRLDTVIGPFDSIEEAYECGWRWQEETRGLVAKRAKGVALAYDVYHCNLYTRDAVFPRVRAPHERGVFHVKALFYDPFDSAGLIPVEHVMPWRVQAGTIAPEIEAKNPQPDSYARVDPRASGTTTTANKPVTEADHKAFHDALWQEQLKRWPRDDVQPFIFNPRSPTLCTRHHAARRTYPPANVNPKMNFVLSGLGTVRKDDKRDADLVRLHERLAEMGHKVSHLNEAHALTIDALQTENRRLERRLGEVVVAKEEARRATEEKLAERDKKIRQLELQHQPPNLRVSELESQLKTRLQELAAVKYELASVRSRDAGLCQDVAKSKVRVRELQELCDAQTMELVTLRASDETQSRALQQLQERNAFLEEWAAGANAMMDRLKTSLASLSVNGADSV